MPDITAVTHAQNIRYDRKAEALYIIDQTLLPGGGEGDPPPDH